MKNKVVNYYQFNRFGLNYSFDIQNLYLREGNSASVIDLNNQSYSLDNLTVDLYSINYFYDYIIDNWMNKSANEIDSKLRINTKNLIHFVHENFYNIKVMNVTFLYNNVLADYVINMLSNELPNINFYINYYQDNNINKKDLFSVINYILGNSQQIDESDCIRLQLISYSDIKNAVKNITLSKLLTYENICLFFLQMINKEKKVLRCSAGINHLFIDLVNAKIKCCRFSKKSIGSLVDGIKLEEKTNIVNNSSLLNKECQNCWCRFLCGGKCETFKLDFCKLRKDMFELLLIIFNEVKVNKSELLGYLIDKTFKCSCTYSYISEKMIFTKAKF